MSLLRLLADVASMIFFNVLETIVQQTCQLMFLKWIQKILPT